MPNIIDGAKAFATEAHAGQLRKFAETVMNWDGMARAC
jgi:hypothetical protein